MSPADLSGTGRIRCYRPPVRIRGTVVAVAAVLAVAGSVIGVPTAAATPGAPDNRASDVAEHWTPERLAAAQPRDLLVDERGLGYLRRSGGGLAPYGHGEAAQVPAPRVERSAAPQASPTPKAKPSGGGDTTGPVVSGMTPDGSTTIGSSATFAATVTDASGVRSVTVVVTDPNRRSSSFAAVASGSTWSVRLDGFTPGAWSWHVVAVDATKGKGNTTKSAVVPFTVGTGSGQSGTTTNAEWTTGGAVQTAAGRVYFEMPDGRNTATWVGYVCSGTVAQDASADRSVVLTAAHCVYDDVNKVFARNVLFIPNQAGGGSATDTDCSNDPIGCWAPAFGVVDREWTTRTFPDNVAWDYAYYVVPGSGAHSGAAADASLEVAAGTLPVQFTAPAVDRADSGDRTHALGYSYADDPNFMYCAEDMTTSGSVNWWLPSCGLSGGSSGGPWVQPMDSGTGTGPVISVNSWGYTNQPGMAGPKLSGTSASALFQTAQTAAVPDAGGVVVP